jgi:hypothetical protein
LADAEPEPLTLANLMTKSLTASMRGDDFFLQHQAAFFCLLRQAWPARGTSSMNFCMSSTGRAALGAQPAVQADVFVLDHHTAGLQRARHVEVLVGVACRGAQPGSQVGLGAVVGEGDAVGRADVDTGVALDALAGREYRLHVAVEAALRFLPGGGHVEAELDLDLDVAQRLVHVVPRHLWRRSGATSLS